MKKAQFLSIFSGLLVIVAAFLPWLEAENLDLVARGIDLSLGTSAAVIGAIVVAFTAATLARRNKSALILNNVVAALVMLGLVAVAFWYAPDYLSKVMGRAVEQDEWIAAGLGYYLSLAGGVLLTVSAAIAYAARPEYKLGQKALRLETRWRGETLREKIYLEPESVTVGEDLRADFVVPESQVGGKYMLFKPERKGAAYTLNLHAGLVGQVCIGGKVSTVDEYGKRSGGHGPVEVSDKDFGVFNFGNLDLVFRFVHPERQIARVPFWRTMDRNVGAALMISILFQASFIVWAALSDWDEEAYHRKRAARQMLQVAVEVEQLQKEEELLDLGEEEDTVGKKAGGEEGKFGDPDEDPNKESVIPKRDGKFVDKIDPKKVGLNDLLSTNKLGGEGAISNILSSNTSGLSNKLAVAMSGSGSEFVMGHGSGGLGFKGTGTGGGGTGYGRIHGLGKIDTGGGTGVRASLGRKRTRRVGKFKLGSGSTAGFCSKKNITDVVRRRAGAIRACYEDRLQVKANLEGKLTVRWRIKLDGRVGSANTIKSTLGDSKVESCVLRTIRRMRFAKPEGGVCIIQWPFVFRHG